MKSIKIETTEDMKEAIALVLQKTNLNEIETIYDDRNDLKWSIFNEDSLEPLNWPDYFSNYYKELSTGKIFLFHVETYLGVGGELKEVDGYQE